MFVFSRKSGSRIRIGKGVEPLASAGVVLMDVSLLISGESLPVELILPPSLRGKARAAIGAGIGYR